MTLALFTMALAAVAITAARPAAAHAQELPEWAQLTGTCESGQSLFHVEMLNPREGAFEFEYQLSALGFGGGVESGETSLAAGETFTLDFAPVANPQSEWRVYIAELPTYNPVGQSNAVSDPCATTTTTTTTTTDATTTTTTTGATSTSTTTTSDDTATTTTDDFAFPDATTTTTGDIDPVASTGSGGGGLAQTGVGIAVLVGGAAVLLFNGIGLARMTRRGWGTEDES
jgi:hypothetical protein